MFASTPPQEGFFKYKKRATQVTLTLKKMVGATGFEPATSCSQGKRATKLRHAPPISTLVYQKKTILSKEIKDFHGFRK